MAWSIVTTTWNSINYVALFLAHYRDLGVRQILVMDYNSTDATRDVLTSREWRDLVTLVPFPGLAGLDSSNHMLAMIRSVAGPQDWCLFCDPDELLVTPSMRMGDLIADEQANKADALSIPRFNVTASRSVALTLPKRLTATDALVYRIDRRATRSVAIDMVRDVLQPPWIYTAIPGKVAVRVVPSIAIGDGDHVISGPKGSAVAAPAGVYLLHYPFLAYEVFHDKIARARQDFDANPGAPAGFGWQIRRWIRIADAGRLREEYEQQFVADEDLDRLLRDGTLVRDLSVPQFHAAHRD